MDSKKLINIIADAGFSAQSYTGRAMYGRNCVAFDPRGVDLISAGVALAVAAVDFDEDTLLELQDLTSKHDSMGYGMVVYFPDVPWDENEDEGG